MPSLPNSVVIIGAPRSGTNMLRDVLTSLPGACTWPCDEINYVWRHGNAARPDDEFLAEHATPRVQEYIRRAFHSLARREGAAWIVEKTCANSLRVGFVDRILPNAKYIFLVRDGRDAVASAMSRWTAPMDWQYIASKARHVPLTDLPRYACSYASNRVRRLLSPDQRLATWGPRFRGMQDFLAEKTLAEVCAAQWERCVSKARMDLGEIESSRVIHVKYEEFVTEPISELQRLQQFLMIDAPPGTQRHATAKISNRSVGKARTALSARTLTQISPIIEPLLSQLGYQTHRRVKIDCAAA